MFGKKKRVYKTQKKSILLKQSFINENSLTQQKVFLTNSKCPDIRVIETQTHCQTLQHRVGRQGKNYDNDTDRTGLINISDLLVKKSLKAAVFL